MATSQSTQKQNTAEVPGDVQNFIKLRKATQEVFLEASQCVEKSVSKWHTGKRNTCGECTTPKICSLIKGIPREATKQSPGSCYNCIGWAIEIEEAVSESGNSRDMIVWTNLDSSKFYEDPLEVAKAFVFKAPKGKLDAVTRFSLFDEGSLLLIMKNFCPFLEGQGRLTNSDDTNDGDRRDMHLSIINKVFEKVRCGLAHFAVERNLKLPDEDLKKDIEDVTTLVVCLEEMQYFPKWKSDQLQARLCEILNLHIKQTMVDKLKGQLPEELYDQLQLLCGQIQNLTVSVDSIKDDMKSVKENLQKPDSSTVSKTKVHSEFDSDRSVAMKQNEGGLNLKCIYWTNDTVYLKWDKHLAMKEKDPYILSYQEGKGDITKLALANNCCRKSSLVLPGENCDGSIVLRSGMEYTFYLKAQLEDGKVLQDSVQIKMPDGPCKDTLDNLRNDQDVLQDVCKFMDLKPFVYTALARSCGVKLSDVDHFERYATLNNLITALVFKACVEKCMEREDKSALKICNILREIHKVDGPCKVLRIIFDWHTGGSRQCSVCTRSQFLASK